MKPRRRRLVVVCGLGLAGVAALAGIVASPSLRTSFGAAYRAFRDPSLLDRPATEAPIELVTARGPGIDEERRLDAAIAKDFEKAGDADLDDPEGAALAALAMPDLRIPITRRTMRFVKFFARTEGGRSIFGDRFQRSGRYRPLIEHTLREAGLPEDLVWLAAIESGFDPRAVSPAGAAGLFQFMPETGALYGLDQSQWVDDRRSLKRATVAAVAHLRDLYERFGRWDLALAAYNAGIETVLRGMARVAETRPPGAPQTPIGFAELAQQKLLPEETMNYVPQIVAFAIVANNRPRFGLDGFHADPALEMGEIAVPEGTRLRTIARAAGIPTRLLREYNPEILRDRVPTFGGDYIVSLPAERVQQTLASFPAYLEHERVDDPGADAPMDKANPLAAPRIALEDDDDGDAPLPPRPSPIGKNRLPEFNLPGQGPASLSMATLGPLGAKLPFMVVGGDVGWQRRPDDPLAAFAGSSGQSQAASAKGLGGAALEKQLGFIPSPSAKLEPPPDPFKKFVLPNGVVMRVRSDPSAPRIAITVRIAPDDASPIAGAIEAAGEAGAGETRHTITVNKRDVDLGLELAAGRLKLLLGEATGSGLASLRRLSSMPRRRALEGMPYGPAWVELGEALFPAGHPLEGRVLGAREDAVVARDLLLTEAMAAERSPTKASITLIGDVSRERVEQLAQKLFVMLPAADATPISPHPREERRSVEQNVPATRVLYGYIAPGEEDVKEHAAARVATWLLSSSKGGRLDRALLEKGFVSEVKAMLDAGSRASVAAIEVVPAVPHDAAEVEQRLDAEIDSFVAAGPTGADIAFAVAHLKAGLKKEIASRKGAVAENAPKAANSARIREALTPGTTEALIEELDKMSVQTMKAVLKKMFARGHRVVVTTLPKN